MDDLPKVRLDFLTATFSKFPAGFCSRLFDCSDTFWVKQKLSTCGPKKFVPASAKG